MSLLGGFMKKPVSLTVLFIVTLGLVGCALNFLKKDRPFPTQPVLSAEIKQELALKKITDFPIFVSRETNYYDASQEIPTEGLSRSFTRDTPRLSSPSATYIIVGETFAAFFEKQLEESGFRVVKKICTQCLTVKIDLSYHLKENFMVIASLTILSVRPKVFYRGQVVLETRDDWGYSARNSIVTSRDYDLNRAATFVAKQAVEEMLQAWDILIILGQPYAIK